MKRAALILAVLAAILTAAAAPVRTATENFVTNKIAEAEARSAGALGAKQDALPYETNAIPYAAIAGAPSVSEPIAPSVAPAAAGKPADAKATGDALAGKLGRAEAIAGYTEWKVESIALGYQYVSCEWDDAHTGWSVGMQRIVAAPSENPPEMGYEIVNFVVFIPGERDATELVHTDISLSRVKIRPTRTSELTNDALPEWRTRTMFSHDIRFVTNGMARVSAVYPEFACDTTGWPDGAAMFVRVDETTHAAYDVRPPIRLVGYGAWPTSNFQSVWWRSGTNIFVNVLVEE